MKKHISLFSGIGGPDLAAEWLGWENIASCEIADFPNTILEYYWPEATHHRNIYDTDFNVYRGLCDVLSGGFPCQPYSQAGKRLGKEDDRHLWPEMLRAIREIQPIWIVGENVLGIIDWSRGLVFEEVQADLEAEGYEVQTYIIPAAGVGAPHQRYRVWFVAYSNSCADRKSQSGSDGEKKNLQRVDRTKNSSTRNFGRTGCRYDERNGSIQHASNSSHNRFERKSRWSKDWSKWRILSQRIETWCKSIGGSEDASNSYSQRLQRKSDAGGAGRDWKREQKQSTRFLRTDWSFFPAQSPVCRRDDGFSSGLDFITVFKGINKQRQPMTFGKWRQESVKGLGNAIVPHVILQIFKSIEAYDK